MGLDLIRDKLNADPIRFPPPVPPDPRRSLGAWSSSSIRDILHNPTYTGFMVWNRRASKGGSNRTNPESEWVWSPVPMHEPLISMDEFQVRTRESGRQRRLAARRTRRAAQSAASHLPLSRGVAVRNLWAADDRHHPAQRHRPVLLLLPKQTAAPVDPGQASEDGVSARAVPAPHGHRLAEHRDPRPDRAAYRRGALAAADGAEGTPDQDAQARRLAEIDATVADLTRRLHRQILNLEDEHLADAARQHIATRIGELGADIVAHWAMTDQLRSRDEPEGADPEEIAAALDRLPQLANGLTDMPEPELRGRHESLDLQLRYHPDGRCVDIQVTLADVASHDRLVPQAGAVTGLRRRLAGRVTLVSE